jgi:hypothetical protein
MHDIHRKWVITKLHLDKGCKSLLDRKAKGRITTNNDKGFKFATEYIFFY